MCVSNTRNDTGTDPTPARLSIVHATKTDKRETPDAFESSPRPQCVLPPSLSVLDSFPLPSSRSGSQGNDSVFADTFAGAWSLAFENKGPRVG